MGAGARQSWRGRHRPCHPRRCRAVRNSAAARPAGRGLDGGELPSASRAPGLHPKTGSQERRPLSIPTVRDRIVQAATKTVIEPIFEADFEPCSFGFRPKRSAHDALQLILDECFRGRRWVIETDIANCFEAIPHDRLMAAVEERIVDRHLLKLLRGLQTRGCGVLIRYADDLVVMCSTESEARRALKVLQAALSELGLELKQAKTRIMHLAEGAEGLRLPRLAPPLRARTHPPLPPHHLPRPLALASGDAARPRPHP